MIRLKKLLPMAALAVPLLAVSCAADAFEGSEGPTPVTGENIRFENDLKPLTANGGTRGTVTTLATLNSYGVSAGVHNASTSYAEGQCGNYFRDVEVSAENGETTYLWPANGYEISFYAHAPYGNSNVSLAPASTAGRMRYTYTVPDAVSEHIDLMTAEVLDIECPSPETVSLTFGHRLADFRFRLENSTDHSVTVKSITVKNFDYIGTLNGTSWTTTGAAKDITLSVGKELASGSTMDLTGNDGHFMLIPQTVASGKRMIDLCINDGTSDVHFYSDLTQDFVAEMGKSYLFTLRLSSKLEVSDSSGIEDWVLYIGYFNYATGTSAGDWTPEDQPAEHMLASISGWERENND